MVNLTVLERISRFISHERNVRPMRRWSARFSFGEINNKNWYLKKLIKQIRNILFLISGNDITSMLMCKTYSKRIAYLKKFFN